jgi:large subunit ribosomal protein L6
MSDRKLIKRFVLKGLGSRFFSNEANIISFKIGFSHLIEFKLPRSLSFSIPEKNKLYVFGYDLNSLGNFYKKIRKLKHPNPYTGKGILLKNEKILLKPIKKN